MAYFLFILVNATLFVRPPEIFSGMEDLQLYLYLIVPCLLVSSLGVLEQLFGEQLTTRPITACILGLLLVIPLSHLSHGEVEKGAEAGFEFTKVVLYYLLFVALVNTPARLRNFTLWILLFSAGVSLLAVLRYNGLIDLPNLTAGVQDIRIDPVTGDQIIALRLRGTGLFGDPNEFAMLLVLGIPLTLYWITDDKVGFTRLLFLVPLGLFVYALVLTQSRGGLLGVLVGVLVLLRARFGRLVSLALIAGLLPAMFLVLAGRQANLVTSGDTAQDRLQLWSEALDALREAPLFGIGTDEFRARWTLEAHNSFDHCFAELGFVGGTLFLGAFGFAVWRLYRLSPDRVYLVDPTIRRLQPYLLAVVAGFVMLILTLSRSYMVPTYLILGLATAYLQFAATYPPEPQPRFNGRLLQAFALASVAFLLVTLLLVRSLVRWS